MMVGVYVCGCGCVRVCACVCFLVSWLGVISECLEFFWLAPDNYKDLEDIGVYTCIYMCVCVYMYIVCICMSV